MASDNESIIGVWGNAHIKLCSFHFKLSKCKRRSYAFRNVNFNKHKVNKVYLTE